MPVSTAPQTQSASPFTNPPSFWVKLTCGLIGTFAFLQVYSIQAILPILQRAFHASETELGMTVGATVLAIALMSPFMGMLSDAIGRKSVIVGSIVCLALPTLALAFGDSLQWLMVARFLQGLAVPGITVVGLAYIGEEYSGPTLARLMSYYVSGTVLGGFLGRFVLGHLEALLGWQQAFLVMGAVTLLGAGWVAWQLPASRQFVPNRHIGQALATLASHARNRYVVTACLLGAGVLFSLVGCFTYINLHLADAPYHLSSAALANIFAVYLVGVVITPIASNLIARFGSARMVQAAVALSMVGVFLTLTQPLWLIVLGLTLMSSGVFITQSATITYIAVNVKHGRSLASGLYYACYYFGGTIGAWVCGLAYTHGKWHSTVMVLLTVQVLAWLMAAFGMVKKPLNKPLA